MDELEAKLQELSRRVGFLESKSEKLEAEIKSLQDQLRKIRSLP
jgi:chaperonin cofactor prefoldin